MKKFICKKIPNICGKKILSKILQHWNYVLHIFKHIPKWLINDLFLQFNFTHVTAIICGGLVDFLWIIQKISLQDWWNEWERIRKKRNFRQTTEIVTMLVIYILCFCGGGKRVINSVSFFIFFNFIFFASTSVNHVTGMY